MDLCPHCCVRAPTLNMFNAPTFWQGRIQVLQDPKFVLHSCNKLICFTNYTADESTSMQLLEERSARLLQWVMPWDAKCTRASRKAKKSVDGGAVDLTR